MKIFQNNRYPGLFERILAVQIKNLDKDIGIKKPQKPQSTNDTGFVGEE